MKEHEIDKLFRDKLSQKQFPYDASNWEEASSILDQQSGVNQGSRFNLDFLLILAFSLHFLSYQGHFKQVQSLPFPETQTESVNLPLTPQAESASGNEVKEPADDINLQSIQTLGSEINGGSDSGSEADPVIAVQNSDAEKGTATGNSGLTAPLHRDLPTTVTAISSPPVESPNHPVTAQPVPVVNTEQMAVAENISDNKTKSGNIHSAREEHETLVDDEENETPSTTSEGLKETAMAETENPAPLSAARPKQYASGHSSPNMLSIGLEGGVYGLNRNLTGDFPELEDWITRRQNEESPGLMLSAGLSLGYNLGNWQLHSGIQYTVIREDINYSDLVNARKITDQSYWDIQQSEMKWVDSTWVIDSIYVGHWKYDTTSIMVFDSTYIEMYDTSIAKVNDPSIQGNNGIHSLQYFEIPFYFGYGWHMGDFEVTVQPGISMGFLTYTSGSRYIRQDETGIYSAAEHQEQFNSIHWMLNMRAGVFYRFSPQWKAGLQPGFRYSLNSVFRDKAINQKYFALGVTAGVYYRF